MAQNSFKDLSEILKREDLTKEQKIDIINKTYDDYNKKLEHDLNIYLLKKWGGAALEIGSAAIPVGGAAKVGVKLGQKLLTKYAGRKLAGKIGAGTLSGLESGAVFGLGRGLMEDKNPIVTSVEDALSGAALGGTFAKAAGELERMIKAQNLQKYGDIDLLPKEVRDQYRSDVKNFYKDYIQKIELNVDGKINFSKRGVQEQLRWNPQQGQNYPDLIKDIKNAQRLPDEPNAKIDDKPFVSHYELYEGKNGLHNVEVDIKGNRRYYMTEGAHRSTHRTANTGSPVSPNNIITDNIENLNPGQMAILSELLINNADNNSAAKRLTDFAPTSDLSPEKGRNSISGLATDDIITDNLENSNPGQMDIHSESISQDANEFNSSPYILKGGVEMNFDRNRNHIFTPDEIGRMSADEFSQNENLIMEQLRNGQIKYETPKIDYESFKNPETGNVTIFTREDISKMSAKDYSKHEKEIMAQNNSIGIPYKKDLPKDVETYSDKKEKTSFAHEKSKSKTSNNSGEGKWVTINGNHVLIKD